MSNPLAPLLGGAASDFEPRPAPSQLSPDKSANARWVSWRLALFDFDQRFVVGLSSSERLLELGGWDIAEVAVETLRVTPVHPSKRCQLEVLDRFPRARACGPRTGSALYYPFTVSASRSPHHMDMN